MGEEREEAHRLSETTAGGRCGATVETAQEYSFDVARRTSILEGAITNYHTDATRRRKDKVTLGDGLCPSLGVKDAFRCPSYVGLGLGPNF